jgi:hypothetical protein
MRICRTSKFLGLTEPHSGPCGGHLRNHADFAGLRDEIRNLGTKLPISAFLGRMDKGIVDRFLQVSDLEMEPPETRLPGKVLTSKERSLTGRAA